MQIYLAPLQGLTDRIFREAFSKNIGLFDKTFSPFIRVQNDTFYRPSQCNDILEEFNHFQKPIPQFLGNDAASFQKFEVCTITSKTTSMHGSLMPKAHGERLPLVKVKQHSRHKIIY